MLAGVREKCYWMVEVRRDEAKGAAFFGQQQLLRRFKGCHALFRRPKFGIGVGFGENSKWAEGLREAWADWVEVIKKC